MHGEGRDRRRGALLPARCLRGLLCLLCALGLPLAACSTQRPHGDSAATLQPSTPANASDTAGGRSDSRPSANKGTKPGGPAPIVYLDPGHGGVDQGTAGYTEDGVRVTERDMVLAIALRTARRLRADGITVVMTRTGRTDPCLTPADYTANSQALRPQGVLADLQCRIDKANASGAQLLLSIHMNAFTDPAVGGTETYYDSSRPFAAQNQRFAELIQQDLMDALHGRGYTTPDRGVTSDAELDAESMGTLPSSYNHLVLLGPSVPGRLRPSRMPGALCEVFFLTDPSEATAVTQPAMQDLIAGAFAQAIETFLER